MRRVLLKGLLAFFVAVPLFFFQQGECGGGARSRVEAPSSVAAVSAIEQEKIINNNEIHNLMKKNAKFKIISYKLDIMIAHISELKRELFCIGLATHDVSEGCTKIFVNKNIAEIQMDEKSTTGKAILYDITLAKTFLAIDSHRLYSNKMYTQDYYWLKKAKTEHNNAKYFIAAIEGEVAVLECGNGELMSLLVAGNQYLPEKLSYLNFNKVSEQFAVKKISNFVFLFAKKQIVPLGYCDQNSHAFQLVRDKKMPSWVGVLGISTAVSASSNGFLPASAVVAEKIRVETSKCDFEVILDTCSVSFTRGDDNRAHIIVRNFGSAVNIYYLVDNRPLPIVLCIIKRVAVPITYFTQATDHRYNPQASAAIEIKNPYGFKAVMHYHDKSIASFNEEHNTYTKAARMKIFILQPEYISTLEYLKRRCIKSAFTSKNKISNLFALQKYYHKLHTSLANNKDAEKKYADTKNSYIEEVKNYTIMANSCISMLCSFNYDVWKEARNEMISKPISLEEIEELKYNTMTKNTLDIINSGLSPPADQQLPAANHMTAESNQNQATGNTQFYNYGLSQTAPAPYIFTGSQAPTNSMQSVNQNNYFGGKQTNLNGLPSWPNYSAYKNYGLTQSTQSITNTNPSFMQPATPIHESSRATGPISQSSYYSKKFPASNVVSSYPNVYRQNPYNQPAQNRGTFPYNSRNIQPSNTNSPYAKTDSLSQYNQLTQNHGTYPSNRRSTY